MFYLNTTVPFETFKKVLHNDIYVDKTLMIEAVSHYIGKERCHVCVTKPRRFGKSINANMLAAFYSKSADASALFADKRIADKADCMKHMNQYNVIYLSMNYMPDECDSYKDYVINNIK